MGEEDVGAEFVDFKLLFEKAAGETSFHRQDCEV